MREAQAQAVLLVKAIEAHDPEGRILPLEERRQATEEARAAQGSPDDVLARRAARLLPTIQARLPRVPGLLRATRFGAGLAPWIALGALGLGLASNVLGPQHKIAVLQWPLVGLVAWNLVMYVVFLVLGAKGHGAEERPALLHLAPDVPTDDPGPAPGGGRAGALAARLFNAIVTRFSDRAGRRRVGEAAAVASALSDYANSWRRAVLPLLAARIRRALHVGSAALALGMVAGMYVRGLGFRYEATWESTFFDAPDFQRFMNVLLGPAAAALGRRVPDVVPLEGPLGSGPAAPWIHLYAVTALLLVVLPRLLFAWSDARTARRLSADLPVEVGTAYTVRSGAVAVLRDVEAVLLPYSYTPSPRALDATKALLHDVLGREARVLVAPPLAYGEDPPPIPAPAGEAPRRLRLVLFSLAQTPEAEVHGRLLSEARQRAGARERVVALADAAPFRERLGSGPRLDERRRAWDLVAREAEVPLVHVDLAGPAGEAAVARLLAAAGPLGSPS